MRFYCKGDSATAELWCRFNISFNHLSIHAQQISDHSSSSTERLVAELTDETESRASSTVVSILTSPPSTNVPVQGDLLRRHKKRCENLPEDVRVSKAREDAV